MESSAPTTETCVQAKEDLGRMPEFHEIRAHGATRWMWPVRNRRNHKAPIGGVREIPMGGCDAKEAAVGGCPFVAIGFGDNIRASGKIR